MITLKELIENLGEDMARLAVLHPDASRQQTLLESSVRKRIAHIARTKDLNKEQLDLLIGLLNECFSLVKSYSKYKSDLYKDSKVSTSEIFMQCANSLVNKFAEIAKIPGLENTGLTKCSAKILKDAAEHRTGIGQQRDALRHFSQKKTRNVTIQTMQILHKARLRAGIILTKEQWHASANENEEVVADSKKIRQIGKMIRKTFRFSGRFISIFIAPLNRKAFIKAIKNLAELTGYDENLFKSHFAEIYMNLTEVQKKILKEEFSLPNRKSFFNKRIARLSHQTDHSSQQEYCCLSWVRDEMQYTGAGEPNARNTIYIDELIYHKKMQEIVQKRPEGSTELIDVRKHLRQK